MVCPCLLMGSSSTPVLIEGEGVGNGSVLPDDSNLPENNGYCIERDGDREEENEEEEEEEDDVDFNPFLKDTPSREASSSLSSEIEGLDGDVVDSGVNVNTEDSALISRSRETPFLKEILPHPTPLSDGACSTLVENFSPARIELGSRALHEPIPVTDGDDDDAICKRTRARYSLASFSLDELENFLQETDDEDEIHNVDDEEEYRKFLAAVLLGGDGDSRNRQGNENIDDEDDDNDADFELEIEEALESDLDDNPKDIIHDKEYKAVGRRHKTRRNRSQKLSVEHSKKLVTLSNRPLRPLVPYVPIDQFSAFDGRKQVQECPAPVNDGLINGFTPHQIGQLYCLIHEHVQLLIQVYSICALDPSRKRIASDVQKMILEILGTREQVLARSRLPHPSVCFFPPYVHTTVPDNHLIVPPNGVEGTSWAPYVSGPISSVLDVAPLGLAGKYMEDVDAALQERQMIDVTDASDARFEREPLFPLSNTLTSSPSSGQMPKKTMAAALVEKVKKHSVVPVPKKISKLALRFYPLFNPALYPHKPPPAPAANRVLFTDSEDELLAMGLMEFNTDWKAIQQRFLPCKSKHQIFVRQKNRSSSKAPDNPIKSVRRMKSSPLTADEITRIEEGLKIFKRDWISVWKFILPYRDPSLLPRQWRIATGTQKSYKTDETKKAKRRLYDAGRRTAALNNSSDKEDRSADNAGEGNNSGDNHTDREDEAYVHEAFLADCRPGTSSNPHQGGETNSTHAPWNEGSRVSVQMNISGSGGAHAPAALRPSSALPPLRPYRARRANNVHLVKLAPGLPPVNLPSSVRIMSQSAFKNYQAGAPPTTSGAGSRIGFPASGSEVPKSASAAKSGISDPTKACSYQYPHNSGIAKVNSVLEERDESSLQMHPLLFQTPEARLDYYPLNRDASISSSFSFFKGSRPQLNLNLFNNFHQASHTDTLLDKSLNPYETTSSSGFDFHPLLQRNNGVNGESTNTHSAAPLESPRDRHAQVQNPFDTALTRPCINSSPRSASVNPSSPYERSNELDLDMHLSFTSRKQKAVRGRDVTYTVATSEAIAPNSRVLESPGIETLSNHMEHMLTACTPEGISNNQDAHTRVLIGNEENRSNVDIFGDQSYPGIVMEQEELSDSEEEIGENVEFECEEMADSEGEASDSEQNFNLQNTVEKISLDSGGTEVNNLCSPVEMRGKDKDRTANSPASSSHMKRKSAATRHSSGSSGKTPSNKITKSTKSSTAHATMQKHVVDMSKTTLNLPEKSRKRTCRRGSSSLSKGRSSKGLITDTDLQRSMLVNKDEHG